MPLLKEFSIFLETTDSYLRRDFYLRENFNKKKLHNFKSYLLGLHKKNRKKKTIKWQKVSITRVL